MHYKAAIIQSQETELKHKTKSYEKIKIHNLLKIRAIEINERKRN